jgi:hypothetical protein
MIISETVSSPVITSITATPSRFKIKASAKAFKILSGFYSEPILAIPRELGANAWDSHVKAGTTDKMFEVHAPNNLEPWFSVRDFGTGLSPEDIDTIYTTYFESTKTHENDSDGCMGLGSKTPFNYTDNFNVTSFFHGTKYVYNCYIDESGAPNILPVTSEPTTEHNGLEVKFGVKIADLSMWVDKITRAYEPFRFRPIIKGVKINYPERVYLYEGKGWAFRKNEGYSRYGNNECHAFMGNYCYPVSHSALRTAIYGIDDNSRHDIEKVFNYGGFDLFFDIGDLEVAPNKEQLQYEDGNSTTKSLLAAAKRAVKELRAIIAKSGEIPKTRWEALSMYNKYNGYNSPYAAVRNIVGEIPVSFNGEKIAQGNENVVHVHKETGCLSDKTSLPHFQLHALERIEGRCKKTGTYYPQVDGRDVIIFYTNNESIKIARLRHYLNTNYATKPIPVCYVVTDVSPNNKTFFAHKKYFGWEDSIIKSIESLSKPPPSPRVARIVGVNEISYADISKFITSPAHGNAYISWGRKSAQFDAAKTYYYIDFVYNTATWKGHDVDRIVDDAVRVFANKKLNDDATEIYGINRKNVKLLKTGTWINVFDLVDKHVKANKAVFEDQLYIRQYKDELESLNGLHQKLTWRAAFIKNLTNDKTREMFQAFLTAHSSSSKQVERLHDEDFYTFFKVTPKKHSDLPIDVTEFKRLLKDKYLGVFDIVYEYADDVNAVAKIVNFIDEKS